VIDLSTPNKEQHVHAVFESIASNYDFMNDVLSFGRHRAWRSFTMQKMSLTEGQTAIDLCCGTCDWTIALAKASRNGLIAGLDFSKNMLSYGQQKINELKLDKQITLVHGNAMMLPYQDNSFDYATIGFGLRNVPDIDVVLSEMTRVVRPGGKVVCLELSKPTTEPFRSMYYFYFERILPLLAKWFAKKYNQYKWLPESLIAFPNKEQLSQRFELAGLKNIESYALTLGIAALHIGTKAYKY
jgi:demethylmenaquinone methyltransferase/2-methoxy-6-polyprenyl-1,4-benzoquinol methylase